MAKVILFSRVSTLHQDLVQQTNELKGEAFKLGYSEDDLILIEYKESGISLDTDERLGIQRLKEEISNNSSIDAIIIYEISRLSRKPKTLYEVRDWLIQRQINLICLKPYFRLLDNDGKMSQTASILFSLFSSLSESEMMLKQERMKRGRIAKRDQMKYIGGKILFGYKKDENKNMVIDEDAAKIVREIFNLYIKGWSLRAIAIEFTDNGKLPTNNYTSSSVLIRSMIKRSEYAGIKGVTYNYPAIIDKELWYKVREKAESHKTYKVGTKFVYYCSGLIKDRKSGHLFTPCCTVNLYRLTWINNPIVYGINMNMIDSLAVYTCQKHYEIIKSARKDVILSDLKNQLFNLHDKQITGRFQIKDLQQRIEKINERIILGKMSESLGDKMISETERELKSLKLDMVKLDIQESNINQQINNINKNLNIDFDGMLDSEKAEFLKKNIAVILLDPEFDEEGKITLNRFIEIKMNDGTVYNYYSLKRGKFFELYRVIDDKPIMLYDFNITERIIRKKK